MYSKYQQIYVLGEGRVAIKARKIASEFYSKEAILLDFASPKEADEFLNKLKSCLIISANNLHIFKPSCVKNNKIINYHNALLPEHRGVNAHIWAIYERDLLGGITWHLVDEGIDTGQIILQESFKIDDKMSAAKLLIKQSKLAISSLQKALSLLEEGRFCTAKGFKQSYHKKGVYPPNEIALGDDFLKIKSCLLAQDTGAFWDNERAKIKLFGKFCEIGYYEICEDFLLLILQNGMQIKVEKSKPCNEAN